MSEQKTNRKSVTTLSIILVIALVAILSLAILFINTNEQLDQMYANLADISAQQEATAATLATTEATLAETQTALADMTAKQEATAEMLAATEATLIETQTALTDMTALREATAATLATTEATLIETQTALADKIAQQEATAATLATTEATLTETQATLSDMTTQKEATAATLETTEAILTKTQLALADMTAQQEATAATLASTEAMLTETQTALSDMTAQQEATVATLTETEGALTTANAEIAKLKAAEQGITGVIYETDTTDIVLAKSESTEYVVLKEYEWESYGSHYLALVVKNNSGFTKEVQGQVLFFNADGGLLGASNPEQYVCGNGEEAYLSCSCDSEYAYFEYSIELADANRKKSLNPYIAVTTTVNPTNVILMCKNTGDLSPDSIEYNCLFFDKNNNIVDTDWGYLDNPAPGKTTFRELRTYEEYDRIEVYYSALNWGF